MVYGKKIEMNISLKKLYILFEQGIMSLLNFSLIFVLSKLIAPSLFKDFFLGYSIVIILSLVTSSFANQPLQVFLKKKENNSDYILKVLLLNIVVLLILSSISFVIINNYYRFLSESLYYIFTLSFVVSIYDNLRRISFVYFQDNFLGNTLSTFSIFSFFFLLTTVHYYLFNFISVNMVYVFLIASYFIGIFTFLLVRKKNIRSILSFQKNKKNITFSNLIKKHNSYAMWLVFGIILFWVYTQGVYFLAEKHIAIDDFNAVRIAQNLVGVLSIIFVTFENIMLTKTVAIFNGKDFKKLDSFVKTVLKKNLVAFIFIVLIIALVTSFIYKIYYQNDAFYSGKIIYLLYFFIYQFIFGLSRIFVVALKAMNQTKYVFYNHFITCIVTIIISLYLLPKVNNGHTLALLMLTSIIVFSIGIFLSYKKVSFKK
jgi:O-antigen/teichoic acid export membrane protein